MPRLLHVISLERNDSYANSKHYRSHRSSIHLADDIDMMSNLGQPPLSLHVVTMKSKRIRRRDSVSLESRSSRRHDCYRKRQRQLPQRIILDNNSTNIDCHGGHHLQRLASSRTTSISKHISYASIATCILSLSLLLHPQAAHAQGGGLNFGGAANTEECYTHLTSADINSNSILSPSEYLTFVQLYADGKLDTNNQYGIPIPITSFQLLPREISGIYNYFACGDVNVGCPSVEGIDIRGADGSDVGDQQETTLFQLCKAVKQAIDKLPEVETESPVAPVTESPTESPIVAPTTQRPVGVTPPPTLAPCPPLYEIGVSYEPGSVVSNRLPLLLTNGEATYYSYKCKLFPQGTWCQQPAYEPGKNDEIWKQAWDVVEQCTMPSPSGTEAPTTAPTISTATGAPTLPVPLDETGAPTAQLTLPTCPPLYVAGIPYEAGDRVSQKQSGTDLNASLESLQQAIDGSSEGGGLFGEGGGGLFGGGGEGGGSSMLDGLLGLINGVVPDETDLIGMEGLGSVEVHYSYECKPFPYTDFCGQLAFEPGVNDGMWEQAWTQIGPCVMEDDGGVVGTTAPSPSAMASLPPTPFEAGATSSPVSSDATTSPTPVSPPVLAPTTKPVMPDMPTYPPTGDISETSPTTPPTKPAITPGLPTSPPTVPGATPTPVEGTSKPTDPDDPPYTGPLATTFEYEIFNTDDYNAARIMSDSVYMETLTQSTTEFVEGVVVLGMGGKSVSMTGVGPQPTLDHDKESELDRNGRVLEGGGVRGSVKYDNKFHGNGKRRQLEVLLQSGAVSINNVEDIECSDQALNTPCQKVTAATQLTLINEPQKATQIQFQNAVTRSLEDPGITFPPDGPITYAGPSDNMGVVVTPVVTPDNPPVSAPAPEEGGGTAGWVVPVSIGCAAAGAIALVMLVGYQYTKRKQSGIEYQGSVGKRPRQEDLDGDLMAAESGGAMQAQAGRYSSGHSGSYDNEIRFGSQDGVSPLDTDDVESGFLAHGNKHKQQHANPFLNESDSDSDSSSSIPSGSFSRSFSSSSSSTESSSEDLNNINDNNSNDNSSKDSFWQHREQEAMQQEARAQSEGPPPPPAGAAQAQPPPPRLHTLHEVSEENLSQSNWSLMSDTDKSDKSVYRAGVEALVKEACPDKIDQIDEMMTEYEGREEVLIGHLSTMLAAKNRSGSRSSDDGDETETDDEQGDADMRFSTYTLGTDESGYFSSSVSTSTSGGMRSSTDTAMTVSALGRSTLETEFTELTEETMDTTAAVAPDDNNYNEERGSPNLLFDNVPPNANDDIAGQEPMSAESETASPAHHSEISPLDNEQSPNDGVNAAVLAAGSASAAAAAALFDGGEDDESLRSSASSVSSSSVSSSADSSGWSSDDGLSSIDTSSFTTRESNASDQGMPGAGLTPDAAALAAIGDASAVSQRVDYRGGGSKPTFIPVDRDEESNLRRVDKKTATREDLDEAIQAGDWKAVGATAALIAGDIPSKMPVDDSLNASDFNDSKMSISTHEQNQVEELEQLVESGNWQAVMAAATRFENASDIDESMSDLQPSHMFDDSLTGPEEFLSKVSPPSSPDQSHRSNSPGLSSRTSGELRAAIEELVREVIPEEEENLDEMLLQFQGREEELIATLNTMRRQSDPMSEEEESSNLSRGLDRATDSSALSIYENDRADSSFSTGGRYTESSFGVQSNSDSSPRSSNASSGGSDPQMRTFTTSPVPSHSDDSPHSSNASSRGSNHHMSDMDNTERSAQDKDVIFCSSCSRDLPRTEYSGFQLEEREGAKCNECLDLITDDVEGISPDVSFDKEPKDDSIVCSSCSRNLPRSEYSEVQVADEEGAMCHECLDAFS